MPSGLPLPSNFHLLHRFENQLFWRSKVRNWASSGWGAIVKTGWFKTEKKKPMAAKKSSGTHRAGGAPKQLSDREQADLRQRRDAPESFQEESLMSKSYEPGPTIPEAIAYKLLVHIMEAEGRPLEGGGAGDPKASRNVILDAYADCLQAVKGNRERRPAPSKQAA
jgi:hypothetical protein